MNYTFENRCELPDNSVGKLILCRDGSTIALYGNMRVDEELSDLGLPEAEEWLQKLIIQENPKTKKSFMDDKAGFHKDISHEGRALGGTQAIRKGDTLYMMSDSSHYGPVHPEAIERCLDGLGIKIEHTQLVWGEMPSLDEYMKREGK